ncbi:MAG: acetyl-CoA synthetase [Candidatus Heimdallarchaeota archaeon]|nr:acetyl-CoA synthetase [Candidatus Heimdallarchaeota archaeon]
MSDINHIIQKVKIENRDALLEHEAKEVLKAIGIHIPPSILANNEQEAVDAADSFGYPVVMKLMSPDVLHKTDAKAVIIDLNSSEAVRHTFQDFMNRFQGVNVAGVLVEKMVEKGIELIIGTNTDDDFGPVILFGVGGVLVEAIKDVVFMMCPTTKEQATDAINEIKAKVILEGFRGLPAVNKDELADLIVKISSLAWEYREDILEMDINPIIANSSGLHPVDARIILK